MNLDQPVSIRLVQKGKQAVLSGVVTVPGSDTFVLVVAKPPHWYRKLERKRGIFSNLPATLSLFKSHRGEWVDASNMRVWRIKE